MRYRIARAPFDQSSEQPPELISHRVAIFV
jgi:hypothetical protein